MPPSHPLSTTGQNDKVATPAGGIAAGGFSVIVVVLARRSLDLGVMEVTSTAVWGLYANTPAVHVHGAQSRLRPSCGGANERATVVAGCGFAR